MTKQTKNLKFEQALEKLEEILKQIEKGDLSLEDSIKMFEEGTKLTQFCETKLNEAQGKVEKLGQFSEKTTKCSLDFKE